MEWLKSINETIRYIEDNLTSNLSNEEVAQHAFASNAHYQRIFNLVTGITIGEYIRNRRLSMAGQDLLLTDSKVIDIALKYDYETAESFSKAFTRFHGVRPSEVKLNGSKLKYFYPLTIEFSIQGGYNMSSKFSEKFYWNDIETQSFEKLTDEQKYSVIVRWAGEARGKNPNVFDDLIDWILDDSEWTDEKLSENKQILFQGVFARFKKQNLQLRNSLLSIKNQNIVNAAVFKALDKFDEELSGVIHVKELTASVKQIFENFSYMKDKKVRKLIAGNKTGATGTEYDLDAVYGYINHLKDCDASVQWALFMPGLVKKQQILFKLQSFEYKTMPAMRFIGKECSKKNKKLLGEIFKNLDTLNEYNLDLKYDVLFIHQNGECVENGPEYRMWGRFMKANTPVPEGFKYIDFEQNSNCQNGLPYVSKFAYATFKGCNFTMHMTKGYDSCAMYDITRNIMLGQGVTIPYPDKYWVAEVFLNGYKKPSTAFMFCADY